MAFGGRRPRSARDNRDKFDYSSASPANNGRLEAE